MSHKDMKKIKKAIKEHQFCEKFAFDFSFFKFGENLHHYEDGSYTFYPCDGAVQEDGVLTLSHDYFMKYNSHSHFKFFKDGSVDYKLPIKAKYLHDQDALFVPYDFINITEFKRVFEYAEVEHGYYLYLSEGLEYKQDHWLHMNYEWVNEFLPDSVVFEANGDVCFYLPKNTVYHDDGAFTVPSVETSFTHLKGPYLFKHFPHAEYNFFDKSYTVYPPTWLEVDSEYKTAAMTSSDFMEHFDFCLPTGVSITPVGCMTFLLPTEARFYEGKIIFPEGTVHPTWLPFDIEWHANHNHEIEMKIPHGVYYVSDKHLLQLDHYWANFFMPEFVELHDDGVVLVHLPYATEYHPDGTFTIPENAAYFFDFPYPQFVNNSVFYPNDQYSWAFKKPTNCEFNKEKGTLKFPIETFNSIFSNYLPYDFSFSANGFVEFFMPKGTMFENGQLYIPTGVIDPLLLPVELDFQFSQHGMVHFYLPQGCTYKADTGLLVIDHLWAKKFLPSFMHFSKDGFMTIDLPSSWYKNAAGDICLKNEDLFFCKNEWQKKREFNFNYQKELLKKAS